MNEMYVVVIESVEIYPVSELGGEAQKWRVQLVGGSASSSVSDCNLQDYGVVIIRRCLHGSTLHSC